MLIVTADQGESAWHHFSGGGGGGVAVTRL